MVESSERELGLTLDLAREEVRSLLLKEAESQRWQRFHAMAKRQAEFVSHISEAVSHPIRTWNMSARNLNRNCA